MMPEATDNPKTEVVTVKTSHNQQIVRKKETIPDLNNQCAYCDEYHRDMFDGGDCTHCYEIQGNLGGT